MHFVSTAVVAVTVSGFVLSGSGPITGSRVTLYAAGAASSRPLGTSTTARDGSFQIRAPLPSNDVVYAIARGGVSPHQTKPNPAIALMSVVPQRTSNRIVVNELTTVASGYAFARFLHGTTLAGASPGLQNAAATTFNLVAPLGGLSPVLASPPNGTATEALATFNSLADVLAACVASSPPSCSRFFASVRPAGGTAPSNTLAAVVDVAHDPAHAAAAIFRLLPPAPPYTPVLQRAPTAWFLALKYTAGGFAAPGRVAFDAAGNVWSTNNFQPAPAPTQTPGSSIAVLSPAGKPILGSPIAGGGVDGAGFGIAIDRHNRVWVGNVTGDSISLFSGDGRALSPDRGWRDGEIDAPQGLAVDLLGNVWIPNSALKMHTKGSITEYVGGDHTNARTFRPEGIDKPFSIAVDAANDIWIANSGTNGSVVVLRNDGTPLYAPIASPQMRSLKGIAVDSAGNAWTAGFGSRYVFEILANGTIASSSPISTAGMRGPWGVAVDGDDKVWIADFTGHNVIELCGRDTAQCPPGTRTGAPLSPPGGFTSQAFQRLTAVQIDASGNVWVTNNIHTTAPGGHYEGGDGLVELIGLAAPVRTPLIGPPRRP